MPVAGESFGNRQKRIKKLKVGNIIVLKREKHNEYDKNAIVLYSKFGNIGYIPSDKNAKLSKYMDSGGKPWAWVRKITGGTKGKPDRGVVITISEDEKYFRSIIDDVIAEGNPPELVIVPELSKPWYILLFETLSGLMILAFLVWLFFF